ncbi:MAG: aspartate aminotransferase family protein [candidate division NC10 bacterium]|nr:aspartate aminotransferase family protein [candidate division NC10 bacterium]
MSELDANELLKTDKAHLIHPLSHPQDHTEPLIFVRGKGAVLTDVRGRQYIDGLSGLWNVNVGHGRQELAEAAATQMSTLAYCSAYAGASNVPAIQLAARLSELAYPSLNTVFFASGGGEANESAFKTARFYWKAKGKPDKIKIIARQLAYHGVTLATMSATGMPAYWKMFEPRVPGFTHIPSPYPYRFEGVREGESIGAAASRALEEAILREGPETVAAFIAEPVQGAGGVIVPPDDYFPRVREICSRYDVLFIADEVITGFGRTGRWFALMRWGVEPDILSFAKGITSGYLPLGGIMVSDEIRDTILSVPYEDRWMHAYTYSGHPTCCAVALKNLEILEDEGLVGRAEQMGKKLLEGLQALYELPAVGDVRGLGLMAAVELVADREKKTPFDPVLRVGRRVRREAQERGLFTRFIRDVLALAPPLVVTEEQVDRIVEGLRGAIQAVVPGCA